MTAAEMVARSRGERGLPEHVNDESTPRRDRGVAGRRGPGGDGLTFGVRVIEGSSKEGAMMPLSPTQISRLRAIAAQVRARLANEANR